MFRFHTIIDAAEELKLLCIGAHSDDIEIGCGGTLLWLLSMGKRISVYWVVLSAYVDREKEAWRRADAERWRRLGSFLRRRNAWNKGGAYSSCDSYCHTPGRGHNSTCLDPVPTSLNLTFHTPTPRTQRAASQGL